MSDREYIEKMSQVYPDEELIQRIKAKMSASITQPALTIPCGKLIARIILRPVATLVTAGVVICLVAVAVIGLTISGKTNRSLSGGNVFTLTAYAMENSKDGTVTRGDNSILDKDGEIGAIARYNEDSGTVTFLTQLYLYGENISSVRFIVNEGIFVYHIRSDLDEELLLQEKAMNYKHGNQPWQIVPNDIFEQSGNSVLQIDEDALSGDIVLFWTLGPVNEDAFFPQEVIVSAEATFNDGTTGKQVVSFDSSRNASTVREIFVHNR